MRIFIGALAFLCLFGAIALYDTAPYLIQNSDWISPTVIRSVAFLLGGIGVLVALSAIMPRGKGRKAKKA